MSEPIIRITSGEYTLIADGSLFLSSEDTTSLVFGNPTEPLTIEFRFEKDDTGKSSIKPFPDTQARKLTLTLVNFNNSLGTGTTKPIEVGTLNGKRLFLAFLVTALGDSSQRTLHYNLMTTDVTNS